jgi:hypothetical protein
VPSEAGPGEDARAPDQAPALDGGGFGSELSNREDLEGLTGGDATEATPNGAASEAWRARAGSSPYEFTTAITAVATPSATKLPVKAAMTARSGAGYSPCSSDASTARWRSVP